MADEPDAQSDAGDWDADSGGGDEWDADSDGDDDTSKADEEKEEEDPEPDIQTGFSPPSLVSLDNKFVQGMTENLESELAERGLTKLEEGKEREVAPFYAENNWNSELFLAQDLTYTPPATKREKRTEAKQWAFMSKYVQSLQGGKIVYRDVVVVPPDTSDKKKKKNHGHGRNNRGKNKKKKMSTKERIQKEVSDRKRREQQEKVQQYIRTASGMKTLDRKIQFLDQHLMSRNEPTSVVPGAIQVLRWSCDYWRTVGKSKGDVEAAVRVFRLAHDMHRRFLPHMSVEDMQTVQVALLLLGFEESAAQMTEEYKKVKRSMGETEGLADVVMENKAGYREFHVGLSRARFQLKHTGPVMVRNVQSAPDPRVTGFYPD
jgi:hypothetical protein